MANTNPSIYMSLPVPTVGVDNGPDWATNLNSCLTLIDAHDHTTGSGVPISSGAININADLPFQNFNITGVRSVRLQSQSAVLSLATDLGCLYEVTNDLYYNDGAGNQVRITQSGAVAGTPGSIANLVSPASASYVSGSTKFVFQSAANTSALLDAGSVIIRNATASSKGLTLSAPNAMAADYTLVLPPLPASQKIMTLDASGNITAPYTVDGSTISISTNIIGVVSGGIGTTQLANLSVTAAKIANATITTSQISASAGILGSQLSSSAAIAGSQLSASAGIIGTQLANATISATQLASNAVTTAKILDANVTQAKLGTANYVVSSGCGTYSITFGVNDVTNLTATLTTTGRPVICYIQGVLTSTAAGFTSIGPGTNLYLLRSINGGGGYTTRTQWSSLVSPTPATFFFFEAVAAGTYNWKVQASGGGTITDVCLVVAEM
jgi:hypothetical protein